MNEFKKRLAQQGAQVNSEPATAPQTINGIPNSVLNDVFAGKRKATNEMMGHRSDLAPSVLGKMSQAFGMDFSGVQVYRSDAMAGTGMGGMAQGNKVVIGSDVDLNTQKGQALLGHEFSHIRAQSMGIGTGNGLLQDVALEHQADNEGLLAAQGRNIYGESMGMTTGLGMAGFEGLTPLGGGMSATAGAPMQAGLWDKLFGKKKEKAESLPVNEDHVKAQNGDDFLGQTDELFDLMTAQSFVQESTEQADLAFADDMNNNPARKRGNEYTERFKKLSLKEQDKLRKHLVRRQLELSQGLLSKHSNLRWKAPKELNDVQQQTYADYLLLRDTKEADATRGQNLYRNQMKFEFDDGADSDFTEHLVSETESMQESSRQEGMDWDEVVRLEALMNEGENGMKRLRSEFAGMTGKSVETLLQEEEAIRLRKLAAAKERLKA